MTQHLSSSLCRDHSPSRKEKGKRVTFSCNGCEKYSHYLPVVAWRERHDEDPENDEYVLDLDTLPSNDEHLCVTSGVEDLVVLPQVPR